MGNKPLIGIVTSMISRDYIRSVIRGAVSQARECGCDTAIIAPLVHFTRYPGEHSKAETEIYKLILSEDFDGFLYCKDETSMGVEICELVDGLLKKSNKYVMTVDENDDPVFDSTQYDDYYDFSKVVEHLVQVHGYRKIYCLTGPEHLFQSQSRLRAYFDVMNKYGLPYDESFYTYGTFWVDSSQKYAERLISGDLSMPEAIVCGNDVMAMSLIKCLQGAGIRVPEDVAVTGYDGFPFSANFDVTLTTYIRNHFQLGADAFRRLYRNLTGRLCSKVSRPDSGFVVGGSCGCTSVPERQLIRNNSDVPPKMWQEDIFCDNMVYDLAQTKDIDDLLMRALWHSNILYQMKELKIYLYDEIFRLPESKKLMLAARCRGSSPELCNDEGYEPMNVEGFFSEGTEDAENIFISPLHFGERQFGFITLSFGDNCRIYDVNYLHYVSVISASLYRLTGRAQVSEGELTEGVRKQRTSALYAKLSQLRSELEASPEVQRSTETMCAELGLSKSALQKNYKQFFGRSIFEELIQFRVNKASELLKKTEHSVSEIAIECGYSSESYFMKQFKRITGSTPTEYRKSNK